MTDPNDEPHIKLERFLAGPMFGFPVWFWLLVLLLIVT